MLGHRLSSALGTGLVGYSSKPVIKRVLQTNKTLQYLYLGLEVAVHGPTVTQSPFQRRGW